MNGGSKSIAKDLMQRRGEERSASRGGEVQRCSAEISGPG
jgi:hypothetical protein